MKTKSSRFDRLVAQYYPAVYSFAARFTDDPRDAVALTRDAFRSARKIYAIRPRLRSSSFPQSYVRDLHPPDLSCASQCLPLARWRTSLDPFEHY
jgi:hypothetical protein